MSQDESCIDKVLQEQVRILSNSEVPEYHCCNCGNPVFKNDDEPQWMRAYEYCQPCYNRGE